MDAYRFSVLKSDVNLLTHLTVNFDWDETQQIIAISSGRQPARWRIGRTENEGVSNLGVSNLGISICVLTITATQSYFQICHDQFDSAFTSNGNDHQPSINPKIGIYHLFR